MDFSTRFKDEVRQTLEDLVIRDLQNIVLEFVVIHSVQGRRMDFYLPPPNRDYCFVPSDYWEKSLFLIIEKKGKEVWCWEVSEVVRVRNGVEIYRSFDDTIDLARVVPLQGSGPDFKLRLCYADIVRLRIGLGFAREKEQIRLEFSDLIDMRVNTVE